MHTQSQFEILDNGIYKATWHSNNEEDTTRYAEWFHTDYHQLPSNTIMRILHDYRHTQTPSFSRLRRVMGNFTVRDDITLRIAHIYSDSLFPLIMNNATLVAGFNANRQFFKVEQEEQAIAWLLE